MPQVEPLEEIALRDGTTEHTLRQAIDRRDVRLNALRYDPTNLYKQFQYHCVDREVKAYAGVLK